MVRAKDPQRPISLRRLITNIGILLVIPLVIGAVAYRSAFRALEEGAKKLHESVLLRAAERWSDGMDDVRASIGAMATNPTIRRFARIPDPYEGSRVYRVVEAVGELGSLLVPDDFLEGLYLVFPSNEVVVSRSTAHRLERFYPDFLAYPNVSREEWLQELGAAAAPYSVLPSTAVARVGGGMEQVVTLTAPVRAGQLDLAHIAILVRSNSVEELFEGIDLSSGGWAALLHRTGGPIVVVGDSDDFYEAQPEFYDGLTAQRVGPGSTLITRALSDSGEWQFVSNVPLSTVTRDLRTIWQATGILLAAILVAGLVFSVVLGIRLVRPVRLLSEDRERLEQEIHAQEPLLASGLLERLLRGEFASQAELDEHMALANLPLGGPWYIVATCHVAGDEAAPASPGDSVRTSRLIVADAVRREVEESPVYLHSLTADTISLLVVGGTDDPISAQSAVEQLVTRAMQLVPPTVAAACSWGAGKPRLELMDVADSGREASVAVEYQEIRQERSLVFYEDIPRREPGYDYPAEVENRVIAMARSGDTKELDELLARLHHENMDSRHPESLASRLFADDLLCTAMKIVQLNVIRDKDERDRLLMSMDGATNEPAYRRYELAADLLRKISVICEGQKKSHNRSLSEEIVAFVESQYKDPDLSRAMIADEFALSEAYLSQFFKEQTGKTLAAYIQSVRLREARNQLAGRDLSVQEVGEGVGYANYPTFARAFKRAYGLSASEFRDKHRREDSRGESSESA